MKVNPPIIVVLLVMSLAYIPAHARDERCHAPPYGASMEAYKVYVAEADVDLLSRICEMKYGGADRTELYRAGFTSEDIEHSSSVVLAVEYRGVLKYVASQNRSREKPAEPLPEKQAAQSAAPVPAQPAALATPPLAQRAAPGETPSDYTAVNVSDFAATGSKLAAENAKVSITGAYLLNGKRELLYADVQAIIKSKYITRSGTQSSVPLLTGTASEQFHRRALACQTDPSASEVGCTIKMRGRAVMCAPPDTPGAAREVPCIRVEDGK